MFMLPMILRRLMMPACSSLGNSRRSCSTPSMRQRTRERLFARLEVDVGRGHAGGVREQRVDDLDDVGVDLAGARLGLRLGALLTSVSLSLPRVLK